jgi:hypothetical protein
MPAVPDWSAPTQFDLTNPYNGTLSFNVQTASGLYLLDSDGCSLDFEVRSTKQNVPQASGSILNTRFLTGAVNPMTVSLWEDEDTIACGTVLATMLDDLSGALRSLLNAGDNEGRLAWEIAGGNERMLDDLRLLVYPTYTEGKGAPGIVTWTCDSQYPYAQDLNQTLTPCADGVPVTLTNDGSADYDPVFKVNQLNNVVSGSAVNDFTITVTKGAVVVQFVYSSAFPGAVPISAGGHYAEITCFANTIYLDGSGANLDAGIDQLNSEYPQFPIGTFDVQIDGCDCDVLWAPAYG